MTTRRNLLTSIPAIGTAFAVGGAMLGEGAAQAQEAPQPLAGHFHPRGKAPSAHTLRVLEAARASLPFGDESDFAEWERGFIAAPASMQTMADAGNAAVDMAALRFLDQTEPFDSIPLPRCSAWPGSTTTIVSTRSCRASIRPAAWTSPT